MRTRPAHRLIFYVLPAVIAASILGVALAATAPKKKDKENQRCLDFSAFPKGQAPNPWQILDLKFTAYQSPGMPVAYNEIRDGGAGLGLECFRGLEIEIPKSSLVELDISCLAAPATATALDGMGNVVATVSGITGKNQPVTLKSEGIVKVNIAPPDDETTLHKICHTE